MGQTIWWKEFARPNAGRFVTHRWKKMRMASQTSLTAAPEAVSPALQVHAS
jgi:hypothetical protein